MKSKIWLINTVLVLCLMLMGMNAWQVWTGEMPEQQMPEKKEVPEPSPQIRAGTDRHVPESRYTVIAEKNLFDPERKEDLPGKSDQKFPDNKGGEDMQPQNIILDGVILMEGYQKALIRTQEGKTDRNKWVRIGDSLANMKVTSIQKERVFLSDEVKTYEISLYGGKERKKRVLSDEKSESPIVIYNEKIVADRKSDEDIKTSVQTTISPKNEKILIEPVTKTEKNIQGDIPKYKGSITGGGSKKSTDSSASGKNNENGKQENRIGNPFLQILQGNKGDQ